MIHVIFMKY